VITDQAITTGTIAVTAVKLTLLWEVTAVRDIRRATAANDAADLLSGWALDHALTITTDLTILTEDMST